MKITRIKWPGNHPILKGLELNLKKDDGTIYDNLIIAAENGYGKTTILNNIYDFFNGIDFEFETFEYEDSGNTYSATRGERECYKLTKNGADEEDIQLTQWRGMEHGALDMGYISGYESEKLQAFNAKYSSALTVFQDSNTGNKEGIPVKDLLITLARQDNEEYRKLNMDKEQSNQPALYPSQYDNTHSRINRFKTAFNQLFDNLDFVGVSSSLDGAEALFSKNNSEPFDISHLSTGEKQVVYRGTQLLEGASAPSLAMIDEPELSMHPKWQDKALQYYRSLFTDATTHQQRTQVFIATHSDHIIRNAFSSLEDTLIVRLEFENDRLVAKTTDGGVLPTITSAEVNYLAFGICSTDYHIQLYAQLQNNLIAHDGTIDTISVKRTDESIVQQPEYVADATLAKSYAFSDHGNVRTYDSLSTYIRNCIDHPGAQNPTTGDVHKYSSEELKKSTEFLRTLLKNQRNSTYTY